MKKEKQKTSSKILLQDSQKINDNSRKRLRKALEDVKAGRVRYFNSAEELLDCIEHDAKKY